MVRSTRSRAAALRHRTVYLPLEEKLAYGGALLSVVSLFLPWFSFEGGPSFNGLQNVTYLIGYSVLGLALLVLLPYAASWIGLPIHRLFARQALHWFVTGAAIVLLTLVALSVYGAFEWISLRSSIHSGPYITLFSGGVMLGAVLVRRSRENRGYRHRVTPLERSVPVPDEEIERVLRQRPEPEPATVKPQNDPQHAPKPAPERAEPARSEPPSMFDL